jgi:glycosyltransferase involved in cell wall biosynthesis
MRISFLSFYNGKFERGVENWTKELASRLYLTKEVKVYQNSFEKKSSYNIVSNEIKVDWQRKIERHGFLKRLFLDYWSLFIAKWTLKQIPSLWKDKPDIVVPLNGGWQVALIRVITWFYGGKMVIVGHSGKGWDERNNLWSFPDRFIALTKSAGEWAKKVNPLVKTRIIPDGIDLDKFSAKKTHLNLSLQKPIVLAVGALEKSKRLDLVIKAVSKMNNVSLIILGQGSEKYNLEKLGKDNLGKRFELLSVAHNDISKYYRACDVFTLPSSSSEAFGMVYLEAMASDLPVVATKDAVREEIVGNAGILIDPTDIDEYSKALKKALNLDWEHKPRLQAELFSWEKIAEKYENLFQELKY